MLGEPVSTSYLSTEHDVVENQHSSEHVNELLQNVSADGEAVRHDETVRNYYQ